VPVVGARCRRGERGEPLGVPQQDDGEREGELELAEEPLYQANAGAP
jgi:hypothetical protein